ncbi:MAG: hypothetical protein D6754_01280 [Alphaproteobacteria bacterium]|nr:MAG: hypothetical protein D6754_01280 [Alphaproteobacteria bacterium]
MAAPLMLSPLALAALRYAGVAALAFYAARRAAPAREAGADPLDAVAEGVTFGEDRVEHGRAWRIAGRFRRAIRAGRAGPGVEVDFGLLARLRLRPIGGAV